jgi:hypothetical protein
MIDPIRFLRESVVNYAGFSFKIYDGIGNPAEPFPQVVITSMSYAYANSKHCTAYSCTVDLSIYNDAAVRGGNLVTDNLSDDVLSWVDDSSFLVPNFAVTDKRVANSSTSVVNLFNRVLYRRQFTIQIELSYG